MLAAYDARRPTADIDLAGLVTSNEVDEVRSVVDAIAASSPPVEDGLAFDAATTAARSVRRTSTPASG